MAVAVAVAVYIQLVTGLDALSDRDVLFPIPRQSRSLHYGRSYPTFDVSWLREEKYSKLTQ